MPDSRKEGYHLHSQKSVQKRLIGLAIWLDWVTTSGLGPLRTWQIGQAGHDIALGHICGSVVEVAPGASVPTGFFARSATVGWARRGGTGVPRGGVALRWRRKVMR